MHYLLLNTQREEVNVYQRVYECIQKYVVKELKEIVRKCALEIRVDFYLPIGTAGTSLSKTESFTYSDIY